MDTIFGGPVCVIASMAAKTCSLIYSWNLLHAPLLRAMVSVCLALQD